MLPRGAVGLIKALRHRIPEGTPPEVAEVGDRALQTLIDVMDGKGGRYANQRLLAAKAVRDEIAGPQVLKVQHTTAEAHAEVVFVVDQRRRERLERERMDRLRASVTGEGNGVEVKLPAHLGEPKNGS